MKKTIACTVLVVVVLVIIIPMLVIGSSWAFEPSLDRSDKVVNKMKIDRLKEESVIDRLGTVDAKSFLFDMPDEELLQTLMPKQVAYQLIAEYGKVYEAVMNTSINKFDFSLGVRILLLDILSVFL